MIDIEMTCVKLITSVGAARSNYVEAIQKAKKGDFKGADALMEEGKKLFKQGHEQHAALLQADANGHLEKVNMLLIHSEDHLMSAEMFEIVAREFIDLYASK